MRRPALLFSLLLLAFPAAAAAADPPLRERSLTSGWEVRVEPAAPAPPQTAPPEETDPTGAPPAAPVTPAGRAAQAPGEWGPARVPSVFDTRALPGLFPGQVRRYRLVFTGPDTPRGFRWLIEFESVRRGAAVFLNARRIGRNNDPYTPFTVEARGLRPGAPNELVVIVDGRKNPKLPEGWWNWNGIVRPVRLVPAGPAHIRDLGTLSDVSCRGPASGCRAELLVDGELVRRGRRVLEPTLEVELRSPGGRRTRKSFELRRGRAGRERLELRMRVPAPQLWSPDNPQLYGATLKLRDGEDVVQVEKRRIGLRSVEVKAGRLWLNNRLIQLRGASIHEDMPGSGAALTGADMDRIVADLKELGANVTRAHYLLNDRLLARLDRAGIMVWSQAPIWQRDHGAHILWQPRERERALLSVRRTVIAARSHPSVLTHSVANELAFTPDTTPGTRRFLLAAQAAGPRPRPDAPDRRRHQGPAWLRRAVHLPRVRPDRVEPVLRVVQVGGGFQCPRALHLRVA